jgi:hypothetical protein
MNFLQHGKNAGYETCHSNMNFTTSVCTFKNENDTVAPYNYQLIGIPLWDEIYSLFGLYLFSPGIIFSTCRH